MNLPEPPSVRAPRDPVQSFIDVTAKLSLLMGALAILWCLFQLLLVVVLGQLDIPALLGREGLPVPAWAGTAERYALPLTLLMLLSSIAFTWVSWGLLKHREWGRLGFIFFLVAVALANFACLPLVDSMFTAIHGALPPQLLTSPEGTELRAQLQIGRWSSLLTLLVSCLAFAALHGWLVVKLQRPEIRRQFR